MLHVFKCFQGSVKANTKPVFQSCFKMLALRPVNILVNHYSAQHILCADCLGIGWKVYIICTFCCPVDTVQWIGIVLKSQTLQWCGGFRRDASKRKKWMHWDTILRPIWKLCQQLAPIAFDANLAPGSTTCIGSKFGHQVAPLASVANLTIKWRNIALLVKVVNRVLKCSKSGQK